MTLTFEKAMMKVLTIFDATTKHLTIITNLIGSFFFGADAEGPV